MGRHFYYMSPEQINDFKHVDVRTDIFALGVILFEMITNSPHCGLSEIDSELPPPFNILVKRMIRRDREERYQSIAELLGDFDRLLKVYGGTVSYTDPDRDFDQAVASLTESEEMSAGKLAQIFSILADHKDAPDFNLQKLDLLTSSLLAAIAASDQDMFAQIVEFYTDAIDRVMNSHFTFSRMNGWTDFLRRAYDLGSFQAKRLCLDKIMHMAISMDQWHSMEVLVEMLSAISSNAEIAVAIDVIGGGNYQGTLASALVGKRLSPRLRAFLKAAPE
jgi:serine/threonine protein kinase